MRILQAFFFKMKASAKGSAVKLGVTGGQQTMLVYHSSWKNAKRFELWRIH